MSFHFAKDKCNQAVIKQGLHFYLDVYVSLCEGCARGFRERSILHCLVIIAEYLYCGSCDRVELCYACQELDHGKDCAPLCSVACEVVHIYVYWGLAVDFIGFICGFYDVGMNYQMSLH